jgi:hypothetical protein
MLDLYTKNVQRLLTREFPVPAVIWLGDGHPMTDNGKRQIAANLAHMLHGVLLIDKDAA